MSEGGFPRMMPLQTDASLSLGQQLASQRKARGWSAADMALQLKIAEPVVLALETDDWTATGVSEQFMRGYARNYAQLLGIEMPPQWVEERADASASLSSVNQLERPVHYVPAARGNRRWRWLWLGVLLAIVLVALWSQASLFQDVNLSSWFSQENK